MIILSQKKNRFPEKLDFVTTLGYEPIVTPGMNWFVLRVASNKEDSVKQTLLKKIGGGRIAAHEIMIGTPAIRNLIREGKIAQMYSAIQTGQGSGMQTLDQNLAELMTKGLINKEEARFRAVNKENF